MAISAGAVVLVIDSMLPSVYLSVVPDFAEQPRVVVTTMTKYFAYEVDTKPIRLPDIGEINTDGVPLQPFECTVEFLKISKTPVEDSSKLDYTMAWFHAAVRPIDGPMAGKEIEIRYRAHLDIGGGDMDRSKENSCRYKEVGLSLPVYSKQKGCSMKLAGLRRHRARLTHPILLWPVVAS